MTFPFFFAVCCECDSLFFCLWIANLASFVAPFVSRYSRYGIQSPLAPCRVSIFAPSCTPLHTDPSFWLYSVSDTRVTMEAVSTRHSTSTPASCAVVVGVPLTILGRGEPLSISSTSGSSHFLISLMVALGSRTQIGHPTPEAKPNWPIAG